MCSVTDWQFRALDGKAYKQLNALFRAAAINKLKEILMRFSDSQMLAALAAAQPQWLPPHRAHCDWTSWSIGGRVGESGDELLSLVATWWTMRWTTITYYKLLCGKLFSSYCHWLLLHGELPSATKSYCSCSSLDYCTVSAPKQIQSEVDEQCERENS